MRKDYTIKTEAVVMLTKEEGINMDDGQKQTINHVYHTLRDMLSHNPALWITKTTPDIKHMIWYLETNFPKDMLKHEMGEDETYSEKMQDNLEPIEDDKDEHS